MSNRKNEPLNVMFIITSMPVGGAETLLVNMLYRFDPARVRPMVCCLKDRDELGEKINEDFPVLANVIKGKFDVGVISRIRKLIGENEIDVVVTVGAGDKMFWGRLAARYSRVPVILSALHSTGWPDGVGTLNRILTGITTGFIAVAEAHGKHLIEFENFPSEKVFVIPNGVDTDRFRFDPDARYQWREKYGIPQKSPVAGIVAALRHEKNHGLFVNAAAQTLEQQPEAHFVIVGDGPERENIEKQISELQVADRVHLVGCTHDIPGVLSMMDLFALTSHNEASPVSILEAMCCERPVVSTNVGSISESVIQGETGFLVDEGSLEQTVASWCRILSDTQLAKDLGCSGREHVLKTSSLDSMTTGYTELFETLYRQQRGGSIANATLPIGESHQTKS